MKAAKKEKPLRTLESAPSQAPKEVEVLEKDDWWTLEREKALDLLFTGMSKSECARQLGKNRETIVLWSQNPLFKARLSDRLNDHVSETRLRRIRQTTHFGDKSAALLERSFKQAAADPTDATAQLAVRTWAEKFKQFREEERRDFGDDVKKSQVSVLGRLDVNQTSSREISLKAFIAGALQDGTARLDAAAGEADPAHALAAILGQALLGSPAVMDVINEEDRQALEAE